MSTELRSPLAWLLLPVTGLVMVFILAPLAVTVAMSISDSPYVVFPPRGFTLGWYAKILQDPDFQASLWFSTMLALGATAGALLLGVPAAFAVARHEFLGRGARAAPAFRHDPQQQHPAQHADRPCAGDGALCRAHRHR
jgi:putative spermidine/putrescine transport system permease protein